MQRQEDRHRDERAGSLRERTTPPGGGPTPGSPPATGIAGWLQTAWERGWLSGLVLAVSVFVAYQPAWHGKPVWDDEAHIARPELHSLAGLVRTWVEPGATQQYYPLVYTVFWLEHRLWGGSTLGYHLLNILLHAASALLLLRILHRLALPGAWLAAAVFALHPVQVESVAWMSELKNTLSGLLCLSSVWAYLHFDQSRSRRWWLLAAALFALGLTAKTAIAPLPAVLAVLLWWLRGTLSWKTGLRPLVPFFALGLLAGLFTAHLERNLFGAQGWEFNLSFLQRCLMAGHSLCFHLRQLFWPAQLSFMYPRWDIRPSLGWPYLYPGFMLLLLASCWALRRRNRGPLAALLWFAGLLFPALGFFNAYSFRYSFVNDHHQYLACIGLIVLTAAGLAGLLGRWGWWGRARGHLVCLGLLGTLAGLTWQQSGVYKDMETLWRTTIARNPTCLIAHNELGAVFLSQGRLDEALACFEKALESVEFPSGMVKADNNLYLHFAGPKGAFAVVAGAHVNLGNALLKNGQVDEAMAHYRKALEIQPGMAEADNNLGNALLDKGQLDEAMAHFQKALEIQPHLAPAHCRLGDILFKKGQADEAMVHYQEALEIQPDLVDAHFNFANVLLQAGQTDEAVAHYEKASAIQPGDAMVHNNLGVALKQKGQVDEAIAQFKRALEIQPDFVMAHGNLGGALKQKGQALEAIASFQKALQIQPDYAPACDNLAWLLATSPQGPVRNGARAIELARQAEHLSGGENPAYIETLAAAYAEAGQFSEAISTAQRALQLAVAQNDRALADGLRQQIQFYQAGSPFRDAGSTNAPASPSRP